MLGACRKSNSTLCQEVVKKNLEPTAQKVGKWVLGGGEGGTSP